MVARAQAGAEGWTASASTEALKAAGLSTVELMTMIKGHAHLLGRWVIGFRKFELFLFLSYCG
jgi:hypothetical protein